MVEMSGQYLEFLMKQSNLWFKVIRGMPEDAKMVRLGYNSDVDLIYLVFEHPVFKEIEPGEKIPKRTISVVTRSEDFG
jgi:hypothetical protein